MDIGNANSFENGGNPGFGIGEGLEVVGVHRGRGYRVELGRSLFYPFKVAQGNNKVAQGNTKGTLASSSDFEAAPGELEVCRGFNPSMPDEGVNPLLASHLLGNCGDMLRAQLPKPVSFPSLPLPAIQFASVRANLPGYSTLAAAFPSFAITLDMSRDAANELMATINSRAGLSAVQTATVSGNVKNRLKEVAQKAAANFLFTEPFNILYALRLSNGERSMVSAPVQITPNDLAWRVAFTSAAVTASGIAIQCILYRAVCRLAIFLPDTPANLRWKEYIENPSLREHVAGIDFFASPAGDSFPAGLMTGTRVGISEGTNSSFLEDDGLSFTTPDTATRYTGLLYDPTSREEMKQELKDPTRYRLVGSVRIEDLPATGKWATLDISPVSLFDTKPELFFPSYESMQPGVGEEMLNALGCSLVSNVSIGLGSAFYPLASAEVTSAAEEWTSNNTHKGEVQVYLGVQTKSGLKYLRQEDTSGWAAPSTLRQALFHTSSEVREIIEEDTTKGHYRRYRMIPLTAGGSSWRLSNDNPAPSWEEGAVEDSFTVIPLKEYKESYPGLLVCSPPGIGGWYPTLCRITLPTSEPLRGLVWFNGSGSGNLSLLAFTAEGVWKLAHKTYTRDGVERTQWTTDSLLTTYTAYGPQAVMSIRSGTIFIGTNGVMFQQGTNTRRLSTRGLSFPEDSVIIYHQAADLIEVRQPAGGEEEKRIWIYDLEEGKELIESTGDSEDEVSEIAKEFLSSVEGYDYCVLTRPFRLGNSINGKIIGIRVAGPKGIGNLSPLHTGSLAVGFSRNLHDWRILTRKGLEVLYPQPEGWRGKKQSGLWWRVAVGVPADFGIPSGLEIIVDNL